MGTIVRDTQEPVLARQIVHTVHDSDILPLSIGKPPSLSLRDKINKYSFIFSRLAFSLPSCERYKFLCTLALVCKLWNFSVKFAWYHLILLEFPGKRTETWISSVDPTIHTLRLWYIHRQKEKQHVLKLFKKSWIERLFRVYGQTFSYNFSTPQKELWFFGISYGLLSDPDERGQWEVSLRFWISRFVLRLMSGESWESWHMFFNQMHDNMIISAKSIGNSDIWRIECSGDKAWYISSQSGEAIGWDFSLGIRSTFNMENITWKDLRFDWKKYISTIINQSFPSELFDLIFFHGDSSLYPHGIHKGIKDPLRFSLAKRFVLSHVISYGISGSHESRPFSYCPNSKFILDLEKIYSVENVRLSGETAVYNQVLCQGLSYIQTTEVGMFVLDEIGLEVGDDVCGVRDIWTLLLGCNTWGNAHDPITAENMILSLFQT
ncbi:hypothetical protein T552_01424 [Pneumocystis carinii B80]|uniref:Uncharacterized protein n=1 Tax=Pneumocystis carinii (strain B80) TaxID=1408658 RepID=A0A0W4ZKA1_PNEC8|nr:hypothetical protein T552_01424 [Pneumocystis carinii B80]KTW28794.1 hypothetical protein T552_01424 [Pneumocystis carinii B80]